MIETTTIQEARDILGHEADEMSDAEIVEAVAALDVIAKMVVDLCIEKHRASIRKARQQEAA